MSYKPSMVSRTWGTRFDNLLASPPISPSIQGVILDPIAMDPVPTPPSNEDKIPHDASVFVGSLPCNVNQEELGRLLSNHLADHSEVKSVKVVRDSKGGVCAFLQCEDSLSAASLIRTLRSGPPKPFMGRILRYEPARAFRTLLISYRAPAQLLGTTGIGGRKQTVMLDLPYALRIWRPKGTKFFNVVYNAEAVDIEKRYSVTSEQNSDVRFFMHPMIYDAEAVSSIASFFGPLECFQRLTVDEGTKRNAFDATCATRRLYPFPHNGPRSGCMDTGYWEVKWKHRDDCVKALMTLRRIPHLTVSWAHQLSQSASDQFVAHHIKDSKTKFQPQAILPCSRDVSRSPLSRVIPVSACTNSSPTQTHDGVEFGYARSNHQRHAFDYNVEPEITCVNQCERLTLNWSDEDFPPMAETQVIGKPEWNTWDGEEINQPATQTEATMNVEDQNDTLSTPGLGMSPITPRSFGSAFPGTPTDISGELSGLSVDPYKNQDGPYTNIRVLRGKSVDPTTLFVGGLEMFGPAAWDEGKVRKCFEKYGVLESVKFFRPYNSCSAFAFVKFETVDGPARAIKEEHNRIYEGKAIRVQLRESNPSRSTWKPLRPRGRYSGSQHAGPYRRLTTTSGSYDAESRYQRQRSNIMNNGDSRPAQHEGQKDVISQSAEVAQASADVSDPMIKAALSYPTIAQEESCAQTRENNIGVTQAPALPGSTAAPTNQFTYPSFGYYPAPWFHPYLQQMQYQFPYYAGYPGYMIPPPMPRAPSNDVNASACAQPTWHLPNSYAPYVPYTAPRITPTQASDANSSNANTQSPVITTGFCQNDQDVSVAVPQTNTDEHNTNGTQGVTAAATHPQFWSHYPFQPYHYPVHGSLDTSAKSFLPPAQGWEPNTLSEPQAAQGSLAMSHFPFSPGNCTIPQFQSARRDQLHAFQTRLPQNPALQVRNARETTDFNLSRDNGPFEHSKSTSNSANWI